MYKEKVEDEGKCNSPQRQSMKLFIFFFSQKRKSLTQDAKQKKNRRKND